MPFHAERSRHPYLDSPTGFIALAHRGFSTTGLENSMAAFAAAVDLGCGWVETDAHATRDGVAVALHDASLDRTTDATGRVAELDWAQVSSARIGGSEPVPLLEDLLGTWPELRVNIDVKDLRAAEPVARVIERTKAHHRVCIASFSARRRLATLKHLTAPVARSAAPGEVAALRAASWARTPVGLRSVDVLQVPETTGRLRVVDRTLVVAAHHAGLAVHVWTVNAQADMERLIDLGVDGIVTDRADLLKDVLVARDLWTSAG